MKRTRLIIHEPSVNKIVGSDILLQLDDKASLVDAITEVDIIIKQKGGFPFSEYQSLLHMVYNPVENKFYKQVAVMAYCTQNQMLSMRDNPKTALPDRVTVVLIPAGGCISEWEDAIDFEQFVRAMQSL